MKMIITSLTALALFSGAALAQTSPAAPSAKADPIAEKFAALDVDKSGFLDGKELDSFKDKMKFLDTDKDGKISPAEYNMGVMTGVVAK